MGDHFVHPDVSRVAPASVRWGGVPRERTRAQPTVRDQDAHDPRYDGIVRFYSDVSLVASAASEEISLVPAFPDALSVDPDSDRRIPLGISGYRFADTPPPRQILRRILGDRKDAQKLNGEKVCIYCLISVERVRESQ